MKINATAQYSVLIIVSSALIYSILFFLINRDLSGVNWVVYAMTLIAFFCALFNRQAVINERREEILIWYFCCYDQRPLSCLSNHCWHYAYDRFCIHDGYGSCVGDHVARVCHHYAYGSYALREPAISDEANVVYATSSMKALRVRATILLNDANILGVKA